MDFHEVVDETVAMGEAMAQENLLPTDAEMFPAEALGEDEDLPWNPEWD